MTLNPRAQSAILTVALALLTALYAAAWFSPEVAGDHESGLNLVAGKALASGHGYVQENLPQPAPETDTPPAFPALLGVFALISMQAQWLKLVPLGATVVWLVLTRRLLQRMGASGGGALLLIGLTAASPTVIYLSSNLLPHTLFAALATATILQLLDDRPWVAGLLAGIATLTLTAGWALIVACILTLAVRGRFRSAVIFTTVSVLLAAPWFGWSLAHVTNLQSLQALVRDSNVRSGNIVIALPANEKLVVAVRNLGRVFASPVELLAGIDNFYAAGVLALAGIWCIVVRRNLLPDLFLLFYGVAMILPIGPVTRMMAPVLPLMLWIAWRALSEMKTRELAAALVVIVAGFAVWADAGRVREMVSAGMFPDTEAAPNDWREMRSLFRYLGTTTAPGSVILSNADTAVFLNTGRKTVRGFKEDGFSLYYTEKALTVTPDQMLKAIQADTVSYVVVTPDRERAEGDSFHRAVEALERGGVLRPVDLPGSKAGYRVLEVGSAGL